MINQGYIICLYQAWLVMYFPGLMWAGVFFINRSVSRLRSSFLLHAMICVSASLEMQASSLNTKSVKPFSLLDYLGTQTGGHGSVSKTHIWTEHRFCERMLLVNSSLKNVQIKPFQEGGKSIKSNPQTLSTDAGLLRSQSQVVCDLPHGCFQNSEKHCLAQITWHIREPILPSPLSCCLAP